MVGSLNKIILIGEIDGNVEAKSVGNAGKRVAKFYLKTMSAWVDKDGLPKDTIERHRIVIFNERIIDTIKDCKSGFKVCVEGCIQRSKWNDNLGNSRNTVEIVISQYKGSIGILSKDDFSTMNSMNRVMLIGNLGKDPEIRVSQSGKKIASMVMATSENYKNSAGEKAQKVEWHDIVVFNAHLAQVIEQYVQKGMKLYLEGYIRYKVWRDKTDVEHHGAEVIILDMTILSNARSRYDDNINDENRAYARSYNDNTNDENRAYDKNRAFNPNTKKDTIDTKEDFDDEIPF